MPWVCPICGKSYEMIGNLKKHFLRVHNDGRYCFVCGKEFKRVISHVVQQDDDMHLAFGFLLSTPSNNRYPQRVKEAVERVLWKEVEVKRRADER